MKIIVKNNREKLFRPREKLSKETKCDDERYVKTDSNSDFIPYSDVSLLIM